MFSPIFYSDKRLIILRKSLEFSNTYSIGILEKKGYEIYSKNINPSFLVDFSKEQIQIALNNLEQKLFFKENITKDIYNEFLKQLQSQKLDMTEYLFISEEVLPVTSSFEKLEVTETKKEEGYTYVKRIDKNQTLLVDIHGNKKIFKTFDSTFGEKLRDFFLYGVNIKDKIENEINAVHLSRLLGFNCTSKNIVTYSYNGKEGLLVDYIEGKSTLSVFKEVPKSLVIDDENKLEVQSITQNLLFQYLISGKSNRFGRFLKKQDQTCVSISNEVCLQKSNTVELLRMIISREKTGLKNIKYLFIDDFVKLKDFLNGEKSELDFLTSYQKDTFFYNIVQVVKRVEQNKIQLFR